ncbi:DUF4135 domain-containing protein [Sphingomonas sp. HF-S4]|uniref:DUF4135 domain-containing protein n=1 Tax=Sphingomonas agrestis TaxID=3080540 RepID=A0ABU3Y8K6_9SPHN|nr:DUF4135 domain-containing protein [Sphingomonas sp. HF-S4]MDV3457681.1 DUF4135 domain-containing protein [Sphingomonas sp. HF-S4]
MDFAQLSAHLTTLGVVLEPDAARRAALYVDYLDAAHLYFNTTLNAVAPGGLGAASYAFCQPALTSSNLLQELAEILDFYACPALDIRMTAAFQVPPGNGYTYAQYFDNEIFDAVPLNFTNNINAFRAAIPASATAIQQLAQNFMANVKQACDRIYSDRLALQNFYIDLDPQLTIDTLARIKSTGSDFHKGGKQVLILTFNITSPARSATPSKLKTIYKPSDLEADCLIVGDSTVINRVLHPTVFMASSLVEIYNARLATIKAGNPNFTGLPLKTYRLLPRNYLSAVPVANPMPIRDCYGYIEYLDNDISGTSSSVFGYYPWASSDYLLFNSENQAEIIRDFYRREGAFSALAGTFSLMDMHVENMRVMRRDPYPIDLEICLTTPVNDVTQTLLLGGFGGINGITVEGQDSLWRVANGNVAGGAYMEREYPTFYYQNRLWRVQTGGQQRTVPVDQPNLIEGFNDGMAVLSAAQAANDFNGWFARLANVTVRCLPYPTSTFKNLLIRALITGLDPALTLQQGIDVVLERFIRDEYNNYAQGANTELPRFLSLALTEAGVDYLTLDIPVFYHRIGTTDIMNSRGATMAIPQQVSVAGPGTPPMPATRMVPVQGVPNAVLNRATYYAAAPTPVIQASQVTILGAPMTSAPRATLLRNSINAFFIGANSNATVQRIVPRV